MLSIKNSLLITVLGATTLSVSAQPEAGKYVVDTDHSSVHFSVSHMGYANVSGYFKDLAGEIAVQPSGDANITMSIISNSIDTRHDKRDAHLKSPDFFNVKQFPEISFSSQLSASNPKTLTGTLTMLGKTQQVEFDLTQGKEGKDPWNLYRVGYTATAKVKRSDYGMNFMLGGIGDEVELVINIEAVKQ